MRFRLVQTGAVEPLPALWDNNVFVVEWELRPGSLSNGITASPRLVNLIKSKLRPGVTDPKNQNSVIVARFQR